MTRVGAILLAAGGSRRMGRAKQLLPFAGTTLLRHACQTALEVASPVVAVLGAESALCEAELAGLAVTPAYNPQWAEGMSGSLRAGLACLQALAPECPGALVLLVDQPLVTPADLARLLAAWNPPPLAAAAYAGILGAPAVFARSLFPDLLALTGPQGARDVIARHAAQVAAVAIPAAAQDVDTLEDYRQASGAVAQTSGEIGQWNQTRN